MKYATWLFLGVLIIPRLVFADVKINEVAWMGTAKSQYSEWIELYNSGEESVSLAGWKLVKGASDTIFTLTKSIAPHTYLLVERTTASAPDAVEGITDEAGPFGASGLRNTGEDLSLKDEKGTVIDALPFASGWPAGDAASGKTMQWDGSSWITAAGTPDAPNATVTDVMPDVPSTDEGGETEEEGVTSSGSGTAKSSTAAKTVTTSKKPSLTVTAPKGILQGAAEQYAAAFKNADTVRGVYGYFYWNMGDGTAYTQQTLAPIVHTYHYPGTYTVSLSYYDSPSAPLPILQSTASATVTVPLVTVESVEEGKALRITNNTNIPVDIGNWPIQMAEGIRSLPSMTLVAAKASITVRADALGISSIRTPSIAAPQ